VYKDCYVDVPNAFTPDGDGQNDEFFPRQLLSRSVTKFSMQVYNRWGQQVFATTNLAGRGWDGRFNDREQPLGVYIYIIDVSFANDRTEHYQGNVTLIR
jgi:gliding motility-associated-like protein